MIDKEEAKRKIERFILVQNLLVTSCVIFIIIFARDKPPTPPSNSAEKKDLGDINLREIIKELIENKNYLLLSGAYTFTHSNHTALSAIVSSLTKNIYTGAQNSMFGGIYIFAGVCGSFLASTILDRT